MSWTTHRARILCAALVTTALVVVGAWSATDRTTAAWTNDVHAATDVALGSWVDGFGTCTVRRVDDDSLVPDVPCTIENIDDPNVYDDGRGLVLGARAHFSASGIAVDHYIAFDLTIPQPGSDTRWEWTDASVVAANNTAAIESRCDELPRVVGHVAANLGSTPEVYLELRNTRHADELCQ